MQTKKPQKILQKDGLRWFLFTDEILTYEQAKRLSTSWAITTGDIDETKIIPFEKGWLLYYR